MFTKVKKCDINYNEDVAGSSAVYIYTFQTYSLAALTLGWFAFIIHGGV